MFFNTTDERVFIDRYPGLRALIEASGVTGDQLALMRAKVLAAYDRLAELLPDSMLWKTEKPAHARDADREAREIAPYLGLNELETDLLALLLAAHDLGRMVEAGRKARKEPNAARHHGMDSEDEMRPILDEMAETQLGKIILLAIRHHAEAKPIHLEDLGGNVAAWALATLVRDVDKCTGFAQAAKYTGDPDFKECQRHQNWPERIASDPAWGTEMGRIDPPHLLEAFERHALLPRAECRSYEAYMLQYFAWIFDIVHMEVLKRLIALGGGPVIVRDYLDRRLEASTEQRGRFRAVLTSWRGGLFALSAS